MDIKEQTQDKNKLIDLLKNMGVESTLITENVIAFGKKVEEITKMHAAKNKDYGGAFYKTMRKWGLVALCIRLSDKFDRLDSIFKSGKIEVRDESLEDTLKDIAAYAIMGLVELSRQHETV